MINVLTVSLLLVLLTFLFPRPLHLLSTFLLTRFTHLLSLLTRLSPLLLARPTANAPARPTGRTARNLVGYASARLSDRLRRTPVRWTPLPIGIGITVIIGVNAWKQRARDRRTLGPDGEPQVKGPWQVYVIGALPLRSISRIYGALNSYTLPVWFRVPGYKLYSWAFGVNLDECDPSDLREYKSLSEFFQRKLKAGVRPIAPTALVSPADGTIVNFGTIENRRVASVKGMSYSLDALLQGAGASSPPPPGKAPKSGITNRTTASNPSSTTAAEGAIVDEREFASVNGIDYSLDQLIGGDASSTPSLSRANTSEGEVQKAGAGAGAGQTTKVDASVDAESQEEDAKAGRISNSLKDHASVAMDVGALGGGYTFRGVPKEGNKMFFAVIYLAPGDYHRFHSPTSWVVERRRHFAGELFSVSSWMVSKLADLFVLNERVALLGRWRHGFFSMVPVGATNVGSIRINFDSELRTNHPTRPVTPGTFVEATYAKASKLLNGQPLRPGDEMGGFWLGSTIVLVFEAPEDWEFEAEIGRKVKVGQALGDVKRRR